jgi:hypothetical protein
VLQWLVPSLVALVGIAVGVQQYAARGRQQLLIDLQSDNAAAAAVAMKVRDGRFPKRSDWWSKRRRRELFEALCLASVFERSGRSRSLIYTRSRKPASPARTATQTDTARRSARSSTARR